MTSKPKIVVVVGPTASGKSDLAVRLARKWHGEVISADSRQVYRGMDIGTGKVTSGEMRGVPHHVLDVASPKRVYTVAHFKHAAERALNDILKRGKLPIVCGGAGFYISALIDKIGLPNVPPNPHLRRGLAKKTNEELFRELRRLDPQTATRIDTKNPRRLVRAIEIARALGRVPPISPKTVYHPLFLGIHLKKEELARRIHTRLLARMKKGMVAEVRKLRKQGVSKKRLEDLGLEYRFCIRYLEGKLTHKELLEQLERAIGQYAKRQMTWFKKDKRIHWVDRGGRGASDLVKKFLENAPLLFAP